MHIFKQTTACAVCVAAGSLSCLQPIHAEMSRSTFSSTQATARLMARLTAELEACRVISASLKNRVLQKAEDCSASPQQIDHLEMLLDNELILSRSSLCNFDNRTGAERVLLETIAKLDTSIRQRQCD